MDSVYFRIEPMSSENAVTDEMKEYEANLSSSENVEPSGRFDSEMRIIVEDSIMTVSLDDGSKFEMLPSYSKVRNIIL